MSELDAGLTPTPLQLRPPGSELALGAYLAELWRLRRYSFAVGRARVESANAETSLGKFWLIGEPLLFIAVYSTIFGWILGVDRGVENFVGFLAAGQIMYRHHAESMQKAGMAMFAFEGQIQSMSVPRALFPISSVITSFYSFLPSLGVMLILLVGTGEVPGLTWLLLVPIIAGQVLANVGVGLIFARAIAHFPDIAQVLTHVFRALLYASGVVFPIGAFLEPRAQGALLLDLLAIFNPMYDYLQLARWALMDIRPDQPTLIIVSAVSWSLITPVVGLLWFRGVEMRYGFGKIRNAP